jgi:D-alanyl-D-alanine carboxypeptidase
MEKFFLKNRKPLFNKHDLFLSVLGFLLSLAVFVYPTILEKRNLDEKIILANAEASIPDPFQDLSLKAKAVYVLDLKNNKVLFEKNSEAQLPLASITKVMTAVSALSVVPESTIITIEKDDLALEGDSGLYSGEQWRLGDLLGLILIESSNDGAFAVASSVGEIIAGTNNKETGRRKFVELMNETAQKLGLSQTYFINPTGLDESVEEAGGYGSARDISYLLGYAVDKYPNIFKNTKYSSLKMESLSELYHTAKNTNKAINSIPIIIASKTGYTNLAGGNLVIVFEAGFSRPIAICVLGSTLDGRFDDVRKLAWATIDFFASH